MEGRSSAVGQAHLDETLPKKFSSSMAVMPMWVLDSADQAEFEGVGAEILLELQADLECVAGVFDFEEILVQMRPRSRLPLSHTSEVRRIRLSGTEKDVIHCDPSSAGLKRSSHLALSSAYSWSILPAEVDEGEHRAPAEIAVVRDGKHLPPVFCSYAAIPFHNLRDCRVERRCREWQDMVALSALSRKTTLRCKLSPPAIEVHS